ncbi:MAG: cytochrome b/b6 domain-containing protein [Bdellovibrionales bacterium]
MRIPHAILAILALAAYFSDDQRHLHAIVGYAVTAALFLQAFWAFKINPYISLSRFIPSFAGMKANTFLKHPATGRVITIVVFLSLVGACITGIAMDKGRIFGLGPERQVQQGLTFEEYQRGPRPHRQRSAMSEAHEIFADIFIVFAVLHLTHSLAFRRPMAKFMFFLDKREKK